MTAPALEFRGVTVRKRRRALVDDVTFSVPNGTVHALLGHNGAGKTTLLRVLCDLIPITTGSIHSNGRATVLFAENAFPGEIRVSEVLRYAQRVCRVDQDRASKVIATTGVSQFLDQRVAFLSTGMRQRVAITTALLGETATLVLDEPTSGLDPQGIDALLGLLDALRAEGRTVIICSHDLAQLETICDGVTCLRAGSVVADGPVHRIALEVETAGHLLRTAEDPRAVRVLSGVGLTVHATARGIYAPRTTDLTSVILALASHHVTVLDVTADSGLFTRIYHRYASAPPSTR
ncbi:MAG TPA: ABC transporter ATP-binding protein [Cellulomonas sp.]